MKLTLKYCAIGDVVMMEPKQDDEQKSGREHPNMYIYGGGRDVEEWCRRKGLRYLAEYMSKKMRSKPEPEK